MSRYTQNATHISLSFGVNRPLPLTHSCTPMLCITGSTCRAPPFRLVLHADWLKPWRWVPRLETPYRCAHCNCFVYRTQRLSRTLYRLLSVTSRRCSSLSQPENRPEVEVQCDIICCSHLAFEFVMYFSLMFAGISSDVANTNGQS